MNKKLSKETERKVMEQDQENPIITDPQGCYTGRPIEKWELPVQDADDL